MRMQKAKSAHYLVQLVDLDNHRDQKQEWFSEQHELISDPALQAINFHNIYYQMWALIKE